jgi:hypothetical protein
MVDFKSFVLSYCFMRVIVLKNTMSTLFVKMPSLLEQHLLVLMKRERWRKGDAKRPQVFDRLMAWGYTLWCLGGISN